MAQYYPKENFKLTMLFPNALKVNRFNLKETNVSLPVMEANNPSCKLLKSKQAHFFTLTVLDEQPDAELLQALDQANIDKIDVKMIVTNREGEIIRDQRVGVKNLAHNNIYLLSVKA